MKGDLELQTALIGAEKGHPLIHKILQDLLQIDIENLSPKDILKANGTGPAFLTNEIFNNAQLLKETDVIFPQKYFYPFPSEDSLKAVSKNKIKSKYVSPLSYAIHYWEVSWLNRSLKDLVALRVKYYIKKLIFFDKWRHLIRR